MKHIAHMYVRILNEKEEDNFQVIIPKHNNKETTLKQVDIITQI
jgi:hypothetical protein